MSVASGSAIRIVALEADNARLRRINAELVETARALADQLDAIADNKSFQGIWPYLHVHGYVYTGPMWAGELEALRDAFRSATETKGEPMCPRPANAAPPGDLTVRECIAHGECGCDETKGEPPLDA